MPVESGGRYWVLFPFLPKASSCSKPVLSVFSTGFCWNPLKNPATHNNFRRIPPNTTGFRWLPLAALRDNQRNLYSWGIEKGLVWFASRIRSNPVNYTGVMAATCSGDWGIWMSFDERQCQAVSTNGRRYPPVASGGRQRTCYLRAYYSEYELTTEHYGTGE
ncbi:hypothetical protein B0H14DRAFT_2573990 [Mycena olivaceomarginata]|nr:hypothetical protein B0H14DRAFT_2573990 [Mycena olivaceomarginata]